MILLKYALNENPDFLDVSVMFFHGWKRDLESADTEKKYGKNMNMFDMASRKPLKYDFM